MEDWQKEFIEMIETVTTTVEEFFQEVSQAIEEVTEDIHQEIFFDIEQFWREFIEPIIEINIDINVDIETNFSEELIEDSDFLLNPKIEPTLNIYPACIGCSNYHGRVYNGNLLVCGIHPYGWDDSHCPDWQE